MKDELMTTDEIVEYLKVDRITIYRYLREDKIPKLRVGGRWRFRKRDIDEWLAQSGRNKNHRKMILVVDDEEPVRNVLQDILVRKEYGCSTAADGYEALEMLKHKSYDAMILDLRMPGLTGLEILAEVKRDYKDMRVIILTGYSTEESAIKAINLGVDGYAKKPFDIDDIVRLIES
jgi:excisionase family DNA binding protein